MKIRKIRYQIDCYHMLTFRDEYKPIIAPYFPFEGLTYGIDNEGTINETVRLIFKNENSLIIFRKEGLTFVFEGTADKLKAQHPTFTIFWELFEKIKKISSFNGAVRHNLTVIAVDIKGDEETKSFANSSKFIKNNPFGELEDFGHNYKFIKNEINFEFTFGNFSEKDIKSYEISPFNSDFNKDLKGKYGFMAKLEMKGSEKNPSFSKFKQFLNKAENTISSYYKTEDE